MKKILVTYMLLLFCGIIEAQSNNNNAPIIITRGKYVDGELLPHVNIDEIICKARRKFKSKRQKQKYDKLVYNIKKVLPYARIAAVRIAIIEDSLKNINTPELQKKYIKESEEALFKEFEKPLKKLTISQGRLLIKLIDRETGNTSYELIKTLKGKFSAFMWQSVARLFGSSLKSEYDAEGDDRTIENIVRAIDNGEL